MTITIYAICDPDTLEIQYIGKTNNLKRRKNDYNHNRNNTPKDKYLESLRKSGKRPVFRELEACNDGNWRDRERYYIKKFKLQKGLLNKYKGILKKENEENDSKKKSFNEVLLKSQFFRLDQEIVLKTFYRFKYIARLGNGIYCLVYDNRTDSHGNGYFHVYLKRDDDMPIPSNWTGNSYNYAAKHNLIMRYSIPKNHLIYKTDLDQLPIIIENLKCSWRWGIVDIPKQ